MCTRNMPAKLSLCRNPRSTRAKRMDTVVDCKPQRKCRLNFNRGTAVIDEADRVLPDTQCVNSVACAMSQAPVHRLPDSVDAQANHILYQQANGAKRRPSAEIFANDTGAVNVPCGRGAGFRRRVSLPNRVRLVAAVGIQLMPYQSLG